MSLVAGYSSDEDDLGPAIITEDAFGLSNLPVSKKPRTEEIVSRQTLQAAPDVLAEVCISTCNCTQRVFRYQLTE